MELSNLEAFERYSALGPDFLTWMMVRVLEDDFPAPASEPGLTVDIKGPLVFISDAGEANKITLAGDEAVGAPELRSALRQGKKLTRARLEFVAAVDTWTFTFDAETFDLKAIKLPVPPLADIEANLTMRAEATARLYHLIDELFEGFLAIRLSPEAWDSEASRWKKLATAPIRERKAEPAT